jgi:hypothetical protein
MVPLSGTGKGTGFHHDGKKFLNTDLSSFIIMVEAWYGAICPQVHKAAMVAR